MSIADLQDRIQVEKNRLDTMRLNHAISPLENTSEFKKVRKDIARMRIMETRPLSKTKRWRLVEIVEKVK